MRTHNWIWGFLLILAGIIVLSIKLYGINFINMQLLWPLFILIPGLFLELSYFIRKRDVGLLVPGGILTIIGLLFLFQTNTYWRFSEITTSVCLLSVAAGLYQLFIFFGKRNKGLLIPIILFGAIGLIGLIIIILKELIPLLNYTILLPLILILIGLYIIYKNH